MADKEKIKENNNVWGQLLDTYNDGWTSSLSNNLEG